MQNMDALIDAYIDHSIDDAQFETLCHWLREDAANRKAFARKLALHSEIAEWCIERSGESMAGNMDAAEDIAELPTIQTTASDGLTRQQYAAALSYVLRHTFTPKRIAVLAAAAVLLVGVVLAIVMLSGPDTSQQIATNPIDERLEPAASAQQTPRGSKPSPAPIVANLTAEHNAVWDSASAEGALAPGSPLRAGDRLTLTDGFAEITTNDGAIVRLEAPATIELLDHDNALRLHTGKLVGICETKSSKGFLVRTPHVDITDLGTRFGVDVSQADATQVHVFQGEVNLSLPGQDTPNRERLLTAGQAIAVQSHSLFFQTVQTDPDQFAAILQIADRGLSQATNVQGIQSVSGELQVIAAEKFVGKDESQWPVQPYASVFQDFSGLLSIDVTVNTANTGEFNRPRSDAGATIPAGTRVQSYIILKTAAALGKETEVAGSVTFDRQVIGVITEEATANAFVQAIADNATVFEHEHGRDHWVELFGSTEGFAISEDRHTITFQFKVQQAHDTIRVLVASGETDLQP